LIYVTDGSFEGILTAVFEAYRLKEEPEGILSRNICQMTLGSEIREIGTDAEKSDRVYKAIVEKISQNAAEIIYSAYLCEHPDIGSAIYRYIKAGLKIGGQVVHFLQNPDVFRINDMSQKVMKEVHLFVGILRFKKLGNGIFYAKYEPDNDITALISDHFVDRLSDQPWIIHDAKRDVYALYNTCEMIVYNEHIPIPENAPDEEFEMLWKRYFKSITIESRKNLKLQRQFMPKRYWNNLIEKKEF
jgi:probable DNA metabolism protein